jgi:hypothetical protein
VGGSRGGEVAGLKSKRDIENLVPGDREASIARFVQACKDRVNQFARVQTDQSVRLGYWMTGTAPTPTGRRSRRPPLVLHDE